MPHRLRRATSYGLLVNIILFILKAAVGWISNSIAIISEALNSLTDIIASVAIKIGVSISHKKPDEKHQFGHNAAQPVAAFIVAVFAFVVGIEIIKESIARIITPQDLTINNWIYAVLIITIVSKLILSRYQKRIDRIFNSPAMRAAFVDSINDVIASSIALLGIICVELGWAYVDGIAGLLVALFIFKSGYEIARENIDFLMGRSADSKLLFEITKKAMEIKEVVGINDLRSHYVGDKFHIEIHIEVDKEMTTEVSHDVGKDVKYALEELDEVQMVFVHIDPV